MHTTMTVVRAVEQQAQGTVVQRIWREGHRARAGEMRTSTHMRDVEDSSANRWRCAAAAQRQAADPNCQMHPVSFASRGADRSRNIGFPVKRRH